MVNDQRWARLLKEPEFRKYLQSQGLALCATAPAFHKNVQAEQAALGAMLLAIQMGDNDCVQIAVSKLIPEHFTLPAHQMIFQAIVTVARGAGWANVDVVLVAHELGRQGNIDPAISGGAAYLAALCDSCPSTRNIDHYCELVIECARLRELFALGVKLQAAAEANDASSGPLLLAVRSNIDSIQLKGKLEREF